jgi:regulator of sigma E protease
LETFVLAANPIADRLINILTVALGLGFVIFFHELGHFAVAKWCGVMVERFSIGFGPILWKKKWGETEYALSAIPFGGYVKMLGQDDIDPGQMTDDQVAADPRSYTSKTVAQRMAIISAGVTMNIITGFLFFLFAFKFGIKTLEPQIGSVVPGMPAWEHGMEAGDVITAINGHPIVDFTDVLRRTALSRGELHIVGRHADGATFDETFNPLAPDSDNDRVHRMIGVSPQADVEIPDYEEVPVAEPGSAAAAAGLQKGDRIVEVDGQPVADVRQLSAMLNDHRNDTVTLTVDRKETKDKPAHQESLKLAPQPFRTLGLRFSVGKISAVRIDSPAAKAGILKDDLITRVDDRDVGRDIDPLQLPDYFSSHAGQNVRLQIKDEKKGGEVREVTVVPDNRLPWSEPPSTEKTPFSIPALGVALELPANVLEVDPNGPAKGLGVEPGDLIVSMTLPANKEENPKAEDDVIRVGGDGWQHAFWQLQRSPEVDSVKIALRHPGSKENRTIEIKPQNVADWNQPGQRGLIFISLAAERKAETASEALAMGWAHTRNSVLDIYLTLRNLVLGDLSIKSLHGPIGIAKAASSMAEQGIADFLLFLGLISINLAVINFLPIPVLDGGHMVFLIWEAVARRKPSERIVLTATYMGFAFVVGLMITVICIDLFVTRR